MILNIRLARYCVKMKWYNDGRTISPTNMIAYLPSSLSMRSFNGTRTTSINSKINEEGVIIILLSQNVIMHHETIIIDSLNEYLQLKD